jgi:hypothetical protein
MDEIFPYMTISRSVVAWGSSRYVAVVPSVLIFSYLQHHAHVSGMIKKAIF